MEGGLHLLALLARRHGVAPLLLGGELSCATQALLASLLAHPSPDLRALAPTFLAWLAEPGGGGGAGGVGVGAVHRWVFERVARPALLAAAAAGGGGWASAEQEEVCRQAIATLEAEQVGGWCVCVCGGGGAGRAWRGQRRQGDKGEGGLSL